MTYLILGVAVLVGALLAARWYVNAQPSALLKALKWTFVIIVVLVAIALIVTRRIDWALLAILALLPWFVRFRSAARAAKNFSRMAAAGPTGGAPTGQSSEIETAYVRMILDHDNGEMNGDVVKGPFAGRTLRSMSLDEILQLLGESAGDDETVQVLTAYLDRYHGEEWREQAGSGADAKGGNGMTREEAYDILGLETGAGEEEVKAAHHNLMSKIHPDHGGSTYLATKINQAKDLLLGA